MTNESPSTMTYYKDEYGEWIPIDSLFSVPVDPDPIKLDESGEVVVLIKTVEGDLYLRVKGE